MIAPAQIPRAVSRWYPEGPRYWSTRPVRTLRALSHGRVAIHFDPSLPACVTRWTFSHDLHDGRVVVAFRDQEATSRLLLRWRLLADVIHDLGRIDRSLDVRDVLIDLSDGVGTDAPPSLLAFARRPGSRARLMPNPYLLRPRPWLLPPLSWAFKTDSVYFRGASTGSHDYDANARVTLCRVARSIPRSDCKVSRIKQVSPAFTARLHADRFIGWRLPIAEMNRHRFLIEADGNSSSWDRYMLIGSFGGVPIRFECEWEECWHDRLIDGVNCVTADRHSLPDVIERLRSRPAEALAIARNAARTVSEHLSPAALARQLHAALISP